MDADRPTARRALPLGLSAVLAFILLLLALLVAVPPARAFMGKTGHWTVMALPASCLAVNRPPAEFNARPVNALVFLRSRAGDLRLQVFFWPGMVTAGAAVDLHVAIGGAAATVVRLPANAMDASAVETTEPLMAEVVEALTGADEIVVAAGPAAPSLTFDVTLLPAVLDLLQDCADTLGAAPPPGAPSQ